MYHQALISPSRWGLLRRAIGFALVWSLASGAVFIPGVWAATYHVDAVSGELEGPFHILAVVVHRVDAPSVL